MVDRSFPYALFETLDQHKIRYAIFAGSEVAYLTRNRTPTDLDILIHNDDIAKIAGLFEGAEFTQQQSFPVRASDGEQLVCVADTVVFRYGDFAVDMMANAYFKTTDGATYPTYLTKLAYANRIQRDNYWFANPVDTVIIKSFMRRGAEQNKFDQADARALQDAGLIEGSYLEKRLREVGCHTPSMAFLDPYRLDKRRHYLAAFFFSFLWGTFAVDRFYLGKVWTGLLKLVTVGGLGVWTLIDLSLIMSGKMRDKQGRELREAARYQKLASLTVLLSTTVVLLMVVALVIEALFVIYPMVMDFVNGGGPAGLIQNYMTSGGSSSELLQQALPEGVTPEMLQELQATQP